MEPRLFRLNLGLTLSLALGVLSVGSAHAVTLGFDSISNNLAANAAIGEAQLFVDVTDPGNDQVLFTFSNIGLSNSSITDIYFDDGSLLGIASIDNSDPGVSFMQPASPGNLPSANNASPPFVTSAGFSADSDPPAQPNGVNPGESLGITFDLVGGGTFAGVMSELTDGTLRVGIHVQGFDLGGTEEFPGGSESFVGTSIPEPHAAVLFVVGALVVGTATRRRLQA